MTLEFQPPYQLVNPQVRKDQQAQQFNQTLQNAGEMLLQNRQYNRQNSLQQAQLALSQNADRRAQTESDYNYGTGYEDPTKLQSLPGQPPVQNQSMWPSSGGPGETPSMGPTQTGPLQSSPGQQPNYSMDNGQNAFVPQGTNTPQPMDTQSGQAWHAPGTDLSSHVMAHIQAGSPPSYYHSDMTANAPGMGGQPARPTDFLGQYSQIMNMPGAKRRGDAANIFKSVGEGAKSFSEAQPGINTWSPDQYAALQSGDPVALGKAFPNGIPRQAGEAGLQAGRFGQSMDFHRQEINAKDQEGAQTKAQKLYEDYVTKNKGIDTGIAALAQAASNPATFNTSLIQIGQALGMTGTSGRNPRMIIDAIAKGNPSLMGQLQQASEKGLSGQLTQQLQQGLYQQLGSLKQSNQQEFEQKALSHVQQTSKYFNGDQNRAKSELFPTYQWSNQQGQGGQGGAGDVPTVGGTFNGEKVRRVTRIK